MKRNLLFTIFSIFFLFAACDKEEPATEDESSADPGVLAPYDGTYKVTGTGHSRGTVVISDQGKHIDFDTGIAYDILDENVYDRIATFNRYQIEFFDSNQNQDRIRINLDPNDVLVVVGFDYDVGADEQDIISVTVQ